MNQKVEIPKGNLLLQRGVAWWPKGKRGNLEPTSTDRYAIAYCILLICTDADCDCGIARSDALGTLPDVGNDPIIDLKNCFRLSHAAGVCAGGILYSSVI